MHYKFYAYGHHNILATHKTTLEFTKDKELTLKGDCIIGINTNFDLNQIKKFIQRLKTKKITITISASKIKEIINAEINPDFNNDKEIVIRKTDFVSGRTFAIRADKAAIDLRRSLVNCLNEKICKVDIVINSK